jgi:hypothetical protein
VFCLLIESQLSEERERERERDREREREREKEKENESLLPPSFISSKTMAVGRRLESVRSMVAM